MFYLDTTLPPLEDGPYFRISPTQPEIDFRSGRGACASEDIDPDGTSSRHVEYDTMNALDALDALGRYWLHAPAKWSLPQIRRVIVNGPATIVYWDDGEKTVVKCQPCDTFNAETGLMAAMLKRFMGNDNTYNKVLNHWLDKLEMQGCRTEDADAISE